MNTPNQSLTSVSTPITLNYIAPDAGSDKPFELFEVVALRGYLELHTADGITELTPEQADDLIANLTQARWQITA